jgi:starch-binding outer membrane protein, SusD/RagB family
MQKKILKTLLLTGLLLSCNEHFLDKKPNKSIVVPTTPDDLQALLDNSQVMNVAPALNEGGTDDLFTTDAGFQFLTQTVERNSYIWATDFYQGLTYNPDWNALYQQVFYANVVLEALPALEGAGNDKMVNELKGAALFYRAHAFYQVAQLFAAPYNGSSTPGIPLRLTADVNAPVTRASLKETYDRIILDLSQAESSLPLSSYYKTRPTKSACQALLARTYLTMEDYTKAEEYASLALNGTSFLLDYNTLNPTATRPMPRQNDEILFYASMISYRFTTSPFTYVDTVLYSTYDDNDLRKGNFFRQRALNRYTFKGSYTANAFPFGGIANDEMYITRSECRARNGNIQGALDDLNALLVMRRKTGTFVPIAENDSVELLSIILSERQKELIFRGTRWTDLRRLNKDPNRAKTLERNLMGETYTLPPGDIRYTLPIPADEIRNSGIAQNNR